MAPIHQLEKELEETRAQKRALEALRQMSVQVLSNALHELRTPLVAVLGYSRMLSGEEPGPINPAQRRLLDIVIENANRLVGVLNDFSSLSQGQPLHPEPLDIRGLWQQAREALRAQAHGKSVRITERGSPGSIVMIGDREKLLLAFRGLLSHAIEAAVPGGEIEAEFRREEDSTEVRILGAGAGDQFARGHDDPQAASLRDIILLHGGRINVQASPGRASVLTLTFPVIQLERCEESHPYE